MLKIGITGGIGTGKTFVCKIFKALGIPIYDADSAAKHLVETNDDLKKEILEKFGSESYDKAGKYNRPFIRNLIYHDPAAKTLLESIIHPAVFKDNIAWFEGLDKQGVPYAIKEAGILYESNSYQDLDKIIVVDAPLEVRIHRIISRDHITKEEAEVKINLQLPQAEKVKRADYVIINDGIQMVIPQVHALHQVLLSLSAVPL